ncbi:hypothetical protein GQ457_06G024360 [Hibiscus cannabinus]
MNLTYYIYNIPCKFYMHLGCAWPPPIIEDKAHHDHPFTLLLKPNDPFSCSTCNIQVHKDCISMSRHIRLSLHPHPISHCFFPYIDQHDSRDWDCKICFKKVNIEHGIYCCTRPGCDFVIHVKCSIENDTLYGVVEVENLDEFEEFDLLSDESTTAEIEHVSNEHNLIFSDEIRDNKYCNGCVLPILSSFYYCSRCDFVLHKACAELRRVCRLWFNTKPLKLLTDGIFRCFHCHYMGSGFSYRLNDSRCFCLRCASTPHSFTYQADKPHYLFFDPKYEWNCNACSKYLCYSFTYRCKDCSFALDLRCVSLPHTTWHKCDQHSLTLAYQDPDDYPLIHYCDICEEERDPQQWFYHCETCDKAMHISCVLGKYPFIRAGSQYTYEYHPHPLTFVRKIYYYPECNDCSEPCQDLALECVEHGCKYIVHWTCIKPYDSDSGLRSFGDCSTDTDSSHDTGSGSDTDGGHETLSLGGRDTGSETRGPHNNSIITVKLVTMLCISNVLLGNTHDKAGNKYKYEGHPQSLTSVKKICNHPQCDCYCKPAYTCKDCAFVLHLRCVTIPHTA